MSLKIAELEKKINYTFSNKKLAIRALTHRSSSKKNYEQLEFLGDSLLNFVVSDYLFQLRSNSDEGELSRNRSNLVNNRRLAAIGKKLNLGEHLILGNSENKSGGHNRPSTLADVIEALLAAVYIDSNCNLDLIKQIFQTIFAQELINCDKKTKKDAKSILQEFLQSRNAPLPVYTAKKLSGKDNESMFEVECKIKLQNQKVSTTASSIKKAEQKAASAILEQIKAKV